ASSPQILESVYFFFICPIFEHCLAHSFTHSFIMSLPPPDSATGQDQLCLIYQLLMSQFNTAAAATSPGLNSAQPPDTTVLTTPAQQPATPLPTHLPLIPPLAPPSLYTGHATERPWGSAPLPLPLPLNSPILPYGGQGDSSLLSPGATGGVRGIPAAGFHMGHVAAERWEAAQHHRGSLDTGRGRQLQWTHHTWIFNFTFVHLRFDMGNLPSLRSAGHQICIVHEDFRADYLHRLNEANSNSLQTFHMVDGIFTFYIAPIPPFLETNVGVLGGCVLYAETDGDNAYCDEALCELIECPDDSMAKISLVFLGSNETQWQFILMEANRRSQFKAYGPFPTTLPPTMHFLPYKHQELYKTHMEMGLLGSNIATSLDDRGILIASTPCPSIKPMPLQIQNAFIQGTLVTLSILWCKCLPHHFSELAWIFHASHHNTESLTRPLLESYSPSLILALDNMRAGRLFMIQPIIELYVDFPTLLANSIPSIKGCNWNQNGFHFLELAARFEGGLPGLLGVLQGGKIISLSILLENVTILPGSAEAQVQLLSVPGHSYSNFSDVLTDFLSGTGIPNVALAQSQGLLMLGDQIGEDLDSQDPSLHSHLFHRAATGSEALLKSTSFRVEFSEHLTGIKWSSCFGGVNISLTDIFDILTWREPHQALHEWFFAAIVSGAADGMGGII
ncbi:hypothetical protein BS47DRAFT_1438597, partial [Hydnum rufescens UP504]